MKERNLGRSGLRVSAIGLGCNNFGGRIDLEASRAVVHAALDAGITLFDTADVYGEKGGSETVLGQILGERRRDIVLATKFAMPMDANAAEGAERLKGASRRYIVSAVEASLKRLRTDWIDLYQQHRPDPLTPIEETLRALDDLQRAGKIRYYGCSNLPAWEVVQAAETAKACGLSGFVSCQDEVSLLVRKHEAELMPAMRAYGLGLLPYFPLASGLLTGKYSTDTTFAADDHRNYNRNGEAFDVGETFSGVDYATGVRAAHQFSRLVAGLPFEATPAQAALAWVVQQAGATTVIPGARSPEQARANAAAGSLPPLGDDFMAAVKDLYDTEIAPLVADRW